MEIPYNDHLDNAESQYENVVEDDGKDDKTRV
jgi:hypothetical protein